MFSGQFFRQGTGHRARALSVLAGTLFGMLALAASGAAFAQCTGPGAPGKGSPWQCLTAIQVPGNPLTSFDIGWVNPNRAEYYLADRSNAAVDIVDTSTNKFKKQIGGFVGAKLGNATANTLNNNISGPDGLVSFGKWLYVGDGNSTLKIIDLDKGSDRAVGSDRGFDARRRDGDHRDHVEWAAMAARRQQRRGSAFRHLVPGQRQQLQQPYRHLHQDNRRSVDHAARSGPVDGAAGVGRPQQAVLCVDPEYQLSRGLHAKPRQRYGHQHQQRPRRFCHLPGRAFGDRPERGYGAALHGCWQHPGARQRVPIHLRRLRPHKEYRRAGAPDLQSQRRRCRPPDRYDRVEYLLGCTVGNNANNASQLVYNTQTTNFTNVGNITGSDEVWFNAPCQRRALLYRLKRQHRAVRRAVPRHHRCAEQHSGQHDPDRERLAFGRSRPDPRSPVYLCPASGSAECEQHGAAGCRRRRQYRCQQANLRRQQRLHRGVHVYPPPPPPITD